MFTGIIIGTFPVASVEWRTGSARLGVAVTATIIEDLAIGASVAVDGVCLTVTDIEGLTLFFDVIQETLNKTTLDALQVGRLVNIERSLRFGSEVGGHLLSGHVYGTGQIANIDQSQENHVVTVCCPPEWMAYLLTKGYVALDGVSLTVVDTFDEGRFTVHLIPETLRRTTLGFKQTGDRLNIELESQTVAIVEAVRRLTPQPTRQ